MIPLYKNGGLVNSFNYDALLASLSAAPIEGLEPALELRNELHGDTPSPARNAHVCVHAAVQRPVNYRVGTFTRVPKGFGNSPR